MNESSFKLFNLLHSLFQDLLNFIEEAKHGVIYISFGTTVRLSLISLQKLEAILGAIEKLPQRFIWRWSKEASMNKEPFNQLGPKHLALLADKNKIYIRNWLPQVDILGMFINSVKLEPNLFNRIAH